MSDLLRKPITMSLSIDEAIYPELYARLLPLGKGSRTEMMRQLAQETLVRRIAQQQAVPQVQPHHPAPQAPQAFVPAPAPAPTPSPMAAQDPLPGGEISTQTQRVEAAPRGTRRTSVLPMDLLRGG